MPNRNFNPRPLRDASDWNLRNNMLLSNAKPQAIFVLAQRALITCRDCFGFGHSTKKCPTTRILNNCRYSYIIARQALYRIRAQEPVPMSKQSENPI